jgi:hypothetical protein
MNASAKNDQIQRNCIIEYTGITGSARQRPPTALAAELISLDSGEDKHAGLPLRRNRLIFSRKFCYFKQA